MARYTFGGTIRDTVARRVRLIGHNVDDYGAATLTAWSAAVGGTQQTDLLVGGVAATTITVGANGQIPEFQGPDGVTSLWLSAATGATRVKILAAVAQADFDALTATYLPRTSTRTGAQSAPALTVNEIGATGHVGVSLNDTATHDQSLLQVEHGSAVANAYGVEIHNGDGARSALVIHQYSNLEPAVWIDNTDNKAAIRVNNTHNFTNNPDGPSPTSLGDFVEFQTEGVTKLSLRRDFSFLAADGVSPRFTNNTTGSTPALSIDQLAPSSAMIISVADSAAGFWPVVVGGKDYGPKFATSLDGGELLTLVKQGAGGGTVLYISNAGTGLGIDVRSASASVFAVDAVGRAFLKKSSAPSTNAAGGQLYVAADGSLHYKGASGTDTLVAAA